MSELRGAFLFHKRKLTGAAAEWDAASALALGLGVEVGVGVGVGVDGS